MPNLWRKKNKSYGVSGKDTQGSLSAVRPLSAAFGTTELRHLDEDEAINKKAKVRGASKSTKASSSTSSRSRSTSVPARPKSAAFGSHILPQSHIAEAKPPKRSESPVAYGKPRLRPDQDPFLQTDNSEEWDVVKTEGRNSRKVSTSGSLSGTGKLTVIRYTDKSMTQAADLWKSPGNQDTESTDFDPYQTVYQALNPIQDRAQSIESLPDSPFPREPSIRVPTNSYHTKKSFSTFAAEDSFGAAGSNAVNGHGTFSQRKEHIYDEPENVLQKNSFQKTHEYDEPANVQISDNFQDGRRVPPPPRRSTSLQFEDVAIPTEQYRPLSTLINPVHRKQSSLQQFDGTSEPRIEHITHESTKSPGTGKYDSLTPPVLNANTSNKQSLRLSKQGDDEGSNSSISGSEARDTDSTISESAKHGSEHQSSDSVLDQNVKHLNALGCDVSDTSSSHLQYEMSDMDMLSVKSDRTPRHDTTDEQRHEIAIVDAHEKVLDSGVKLLEQNMEDTWSSEYQDKHFFSEALSNLQEDGTYLEENTCRHLSDRKNESGNIFSQNGFEVQSETSSESCASKSGSSAPKLKEETSVEDPMAGNHNYVSVPSAPAKMPHEQSSHEEVEETQHQNTRQGSNEENQETSKEMSSDSTCTTLNETTDMDNLQITDIVTQGFMSLEKRSTTEISTDMDISINKELDTTKETTLLVTDKENVPPDLESKGTHVATIIHSLNAKRDNNTQDKVIKTDISKKKKKDIDYISGSFSSSENGSDISDKDRNGKTNVGLKLENHKDYQLNETDQKHNSQDEIKREKGGFKPSPFPLLTKPVVPHKPKGLGEKQGEKETSVMSTNVHSSVSQRTPAGLLAPKPFLSKPQKFVPSKILTGNSSESALQKETTEKSSVTSNDAPVLASVIKPFKSVPFGRMLASQREKTASSAVGSTEGGKDSSTNSSKQKPTLAVKPQFVSRPSNLLKAKEDMANTSLATEKTPPEPVTVVNNATKLDRHSETNQSKVQNISGTETDSTTVIMPDCNELAKVTSTQPIIARPVPASRNSVSFLDSLKHKHSIKREPGNRNPIAVKDVTVKESGIPRQNETERDFGITSMKPNTNSVTENTVDVASFLDGLKTGKKKVSPRIVSPESEASEGITEKGTLVSKAQLPSESVTKSPIGNLISDPITLPEPQNDSHQHSEHEPEAVTESEPENKRFSGISIKEMLINDICDLPETSVDTDHEWDEAPGADNSSSFLGLKTIDTVSNREHVNLGVLSPRQLKRSKGKFSRGSFTDQKPVDVVQRRRRLSSSSCSEKESISDSCPNEPVSKASNNVSIQSENSAFHLVKSDDEADTSLDMIADIPEEFQERDTVHTVSVVENRNHLLPNQMDMTDKTTKVPGDMVVEHMPGKEKSEKPTPPPRKNKDRRHKTHNQRSSFSNSDKSSSKQSSAISSESSTNRELSQIEQSQQARFVPLSNEGIFDNDPSEQMVCMPWDNAPWDNNPGEENFVIAPSEFRSDDSVPCDICPQVDGIAISHESADIDNPDELIDKNQFYDIPSPQIIPSPDAQDTSSDIAEYDEDAHLHNSDENVLKSDLVTPIVNPEVFTEIYTAENSMEDKENMKNSALVVPKLNLTDINGEEPPSPFEADEAVSKIFDETVRQSARYTSRTDVATSPRSVPSSKDKSDRSLHSEAPELTSCNGYFAKDSNTAADDILEQNECFKFERNMKGFRSPISIKRNKGSVIIDSDHSSSSSKYSERAIDIQDLDTNGKPMAINKHYEERGVDIEGLERSSIIRNPLTPAQRRRRKENRLSDSSSSQLSKQMSPRQISKAINHQQVPSLNLKDTTDSEASSYSQSRVTTNKKKSEPNVFVYDDMECNPSKDATSPRESLSPTTPSSVCVSEISDIKPNPRDLANINLPGLKLNQEVGSGPVKGSEHLHPALERSLRTNLIPQRMANGNAGAQPASGIGSELMILVEEDYMTPRPGYNHTLIQNTEVPEPWAFDMVHNMRHTYGGGGGGLLQRQDSLVSQVSSTTTITNTRWQTRPVELWENEDLMDWAEAAGFEELADVLHGTGIGGNQFLQFQETTLADLGLISTELRQSIMEEVNKLKEQPKSSVPLWTLKQASVRRKNLEASSNALKSRLTNLQQLNTKQEEQIQSYIQELKDHQKQTELLISSPPPSVGGLSDTTLDNVHSRDKLARLNSVSISEVSAFLPQLSLSESEVSAYNHAPVHPLVEWDNSEVLQWLASSGLYMFSNLFFTHKVSGRDLSEISMQFLDKIGIEKLEERELLLSKLYELQHPGEPPLEEVLRSQSSDVTSSQGQTKPLPKPGSSLKSAGSNTSSTVSFNRDKKRSSVVMGTRMVSKDLKRESPWTPASNRKSRSLSVEEKKTAENNVMIWHQLGGTMTSSYIKIQEGMSCYDVIQNLLQLQHVTDDSNLFYVVDRDFSGREVEVSKFEDMSTLQSQWDNPVGHKLELRQRSGVQIKVFHKTAEGQQKTKSFRIATSSSYSEVLLVCCKKFRVKRAGDFMLLELNRSTGVVSQIAAARNISEMLTDCFILCERTALNQAQEMAALLKRRASCSSQNSSNLSDTDSQATMTSHCEQVDGLHAEIVDFDTSPTAESDEEDELGSEDSQQIYPSTHIAAYNRFHSKSSHNITLDDFSKFPNIAPKPLHRNYRSMDDVDFLNSKNFYDKDAYDESDIPPRRVFSANDELDRIHQNAPDSLELLQELALLKESLRERDISLMDLNKENKELKAKTHDTVFTQNRLKSLESMYQEKQAQWKAEVSGLQLQLQQLQEQQLEADPKAKVNYLETKIEESRAQIWRQEEEVMVIKDELEKQASENSPDTGLVEYLQSQLTQSETLLMNLKQEHGDLLLQLDHTRNKLQKKEHETTVDLFALIGSDKPLCLHALELEPKNGSYGLMIGRDNEKRLMVRHTEEGRPIIKGDRLIEVNGRLVAKLEDDEIANFLKSAKEKNGPLQIVVLREQEPIKGQVSKEEFEQMKDDYSLAMMEVESLQQDNKDLNAEVAMLTNDFESASRERDELQKKMDQLKSQFGNLPLTDSDFAEASPHKRLQLMLDTINAGKPRNEAVTASQLRRGASRRGLDWFNTLVSVDRLDQVLAYDELDEKLPLYESMKIAPKEDVLQALKDTILETKQQKAYLDKLMALVIDHSPFLLKFVDASMGMEDDLMSIKSRTEERC